MKWCFRGSVAVLFATSIPVSAHAQLMDPIRTLCTSQAQEYCASFLSWDYQSSGGTYGRFAAKVQLYGSTLERSTGIAEVFLTGGCSGDPIRFDGGVTYGETGDGPGCEAATDPSEIVALRFITGLDEDGPTVTMCSVDTNGCIDVSEPRGWVLLLPGLAALGLVPTRRRTT